MNVRIVSVLVLAMLVCVPMVSAKLPPWRERAVVPVEIQEETGILEKVFGLFSKQSVSVVDKTPIKVKVPYKNTEKKTVFDMVQISDGIMIQTNPHYIDAPSAIDYTANLVVQNVSSVEIVGGRYIIRGTIPGRVTL